MARGLHARRRAPFAPRAALQGALPDGFSRDPFLLLPQLPGRLSPRDRSRCGGLQTPARGPLAGLGKGSAVLRSGPAGEGPRGAAFSHERRPVHFSPVGKAGTPSSPPPIPPALSVLPRPQRQGFVCLRVEGANIWVGCLVYVVLLLFCDFCF